MTSRTSSPTCKAPPQYPVATQASAAPDVRPAREPIQHSSTTAVLVQFQTVLHLAEQGTGRLDIHRQHTRQDVGQ